MTRPVLVALFLAGTVRAGPPEPGPAPRLTDRYGGPLPAGAVARLGSLRLRHADLSAFAFPPSGKTVVTVGGDQLARTWDLESGRELRAVRLPDNVISRRAALTTDGKTLVTRSKWEFVVCDATSGRVLQTIPWTTDHLDCLAISPDGSTVMYGTDGYLVTLIDRPGGARREVRVADEPTEDGGRRVHRSLRAHFSRDGRRLLVAEMNGTKGFSVLDVATGRELFSRPGNPTAVTLSADGNRVAAIGLTKKDRDPKPLVRLFDVQSDKEIAHFTPDIGPGDAVIHFSADDKALLCVGSRDGGFFEPMTGRLVRRLPAGVRGAPSPDGRWVADWDMCRLHVWDAVTGRKLHDSPGLFQVGARAASPDGRLLAADEVGADRIGLWDTTDGRFIRYLSRPESDASGAELLFANGGRTLMSCEFGGMVRTWDVRTGVATWPVPDRGRDERAGPYHQYRLSPDGRRVAAIISPRHGRTESCRMEVWDAATGQVTHRYQLPLVEWASTYSWLPDGSAVVLQLTDGVTFVDPDTGRLGARIKTSTDNLAFSADGRLMAEWNKDRGTDRSRGLIQVYEVASGERSTVVATGSSVYRAFAMTAGGRAVVVADGRHLRVIDLVTWTDWGRRNLPDSDRDGVGETPVSEVQVLPGDRQALTTLNDGTAMIWDLTAFPLPKLSQNHGEAEMRRWWDDLARDEQFWAFRAVWKLAEAPADDVVAFLRGRLKPAPVAHAREIRRWVTDLGSPTFAAREVAMKRLGGLGAGVIPALRTAVRTTGSAEVRERAGKLLDSLTTPVPPQETLRTVRAVAVLERIGTPDARRLLRELAGGEPTEPLTKAAKSALGRLESAGSGSW